MIYFDEVHDDDIPCILPLVDPLDQLGRVRALHPADQDMAAEGCSMAETAKIR